MLAELRLTQQKQAGEAAYGDATFDTGFGGYLVVWVCVTIVLVVALVRATGCCSSRHKTLAKPEVVDK